MLAYLAVAIDKNSAKDEIPEVLDSIRKLMEGELIIYSPSKAFTVIGHGSGEKALISINKYALSQADVVIAFYTPGVESWGMPIELAYAQEHNKPIYLLQSGQIDYDSFPIYLKDIVDRDHCFRSDYGEHLQLMLATMEVDKDAKNSVE